jgi:primosomal protein N' (replication factor Y)
MPSPRVSTFYLSMYLYHVLLPVDFCMRAGPLTYSSGEKILPGTVVVVPFRDKTMTGLVVAETVPDAQAAYAIKEILEIQALMLGPIQLQAMYWMASFYAVPLLKACFAFLPRIHWKQPKRAYVIEHAPLTLHPSDHQLTVEQVAVVDQILAKPDHAWLLHGITGSGKTEIYLSIAERVLSQGKQVMILVPEIALTPQTCARFEARFPEQVAIFHSGITDARRKRLNAEIRAGAKKVVLGARSALFAPAMNLGLIIVDEEHEQSYHQEQAPRYHAVTVARELRRFAHCTLILGSATPRVTTFVHPDQTVLSLPLRVSGKMPTIELVDMRDELKARNYSPFSERLQVAIGEQLAQKKQVLLFLNRRGFATSYLCRDCGKREICPHCDISLTVHLDNHHSGYDPEAKLLCHYCGFTKVPPSQCSYCGSVTLKALGNGTQKIMLELERLFPQARCIRVDSDTMTTPDQYRQFYQDVLAGQYDIILGTQMIAKGLHLPGINLVGVLLADLSFHFPDYTAQEKTFQLLTQVAGRAGRADHVSHVLIQTYDTDYPVLHDVVTHNYQHFLETELSIRQEFWYPPFCDLIQLTLYGDTAAEALRESALLKKLLEEEKLARNLQYEVLGPAPTWLHRRVGKLAYQLVVKAPKNSNLLDHLVTFLPKHVVIDHDS